MDWDQYIFKKISGLIRKLKKSNPNPLEIEASVTLEELKPRLTYLAQMLCGCGIQIHTAESIGGWKGDSFFLPHTYSRAMFREGNIDYYIFRVFYLSGLFHLRSFIQIKKEDEELDSYFLSKKYSPQVISYLSNEYSEFNAIYHSVINYELQYQKAQKVSESNFNWIYGQWYFMSDIDKEALNQLLEPNKKNTVADEKDKEKYSEVNGKNVEETEILVVNTKEQEEYTLTHNFEKIETLDSFSGRWRDFDGSDDMDEHAEALQEVDMRQLVRVDSPVHSIYKTDFVHTMGLLEVDTKIMEWNFSYPEWMISARKYKPDYCRIIYKKNIEENKIVTKKILNQSSSQIKKLRKNSEKHLSEYFVKKRLADGDEPDLDAIVDAYVDLCTGKTPSENVYISKRKKPKDIAILVLTDCSLSTDGYTNNQRIIDIEKEALITAAEVWSSFNLKFQLDTFSSHTHSQCFYTTYKAFHEDWNVVKNRIGNIQSFGYTRIGAALRHATYILSQVKADKKWLLLISDGKPNDYDTYEGDYGIHDVKKAIQEAEMRNVFTSAIAIDAEAKYYFPKMFGNTGYSILHHPNQLSETLTKFYIQLLK